MSAAVTTVAKLPLTYEPTLYNDNYVDYLGKYSWKQFEEFGVKCACSKGSKIYRNKNSFKHQHCATKRHKDYLEKLNQEPEETPMRIDDDGFTKQIKSLKIQMVKEHESFQLEKQLNQNLQSQIKHIIGEKEEAEAEANQAGEYVQEMTNKVADLETKLKKYETITQEMMKLGGYELA